MRFSVKLSFGLFLLMPLVAWSQPENKTGVVFGSVLNASRDSTAMGGQEVVLVQYVDSQEVEGARPHTVTDARGHFVFAGLEVGERFAYYPLAVFVGIEFSGALVKSTPAAPRQRSDIIIFEPTTSNSTISTAMHHLIIEPGNGVLSVREIFLFANRGDQTYVGNTLAPSGKKIVLHMETPAKATDLQFGGDLMSCCADMNGNQIFDTMEFKPGTRQVVLSYSLPYHDAEASLVKTVTHPTAAFDIFLPDPLRLRQFVVKGNGESNEVSQSEEPEPFQIRGKNYARYQTDNLTSGSLLSLTITNLPPAPRDWRWLAPVILVAIIAIGYILHRWRESRTNEIANNPNEERQNQTGCRKQFAPTDR